MRLISHHTGSSPAALLCFQWSSRRSWHTWSTSRTTPACRRPARPRRAPARTPGTPPPRRRTARPLASPSSTNLNYLWVRSHWHKANANVERLFLPTTREGIVFASVCHSVHGSRRGRQTPTSTGRLPPLEADPFNSIGRPPYPSVGRPLPTLYRQITWDWHLVVATAPVSTHPTVMHYCHLCCYSIWIIAHLIS